MRAGASDFLVMASSATVRSLKVSLECSARGGRRTYALVTRLLALSERLSAESLGVILPQGTARFRTQHWAMRRAEGHLLSLKRGSIKTQMWGFVRTAYVFHCPGRSLRVSAIGYLVLASDPAAVA